MFEKKILWHEELCNISLKYKSYVVYMFERNMYFLGFY